MKEPWRSLLTAFLTALLTLLGGGAAMQIGGCGRVPEQPAPPDPGPPAEPEPEPGDPLAAVGKLIMNGGSCSATVVNPPDADGRRVLVTAAHCVKRVGERVTFIPRNTSRSIRCSVVSIDRKADICILSTDESEPGLPFLRVAAKTPPVGTEVMHCGFGIDRPGNVEKGQVTSGILPNGQVRYKLSVSPGDSGGGICLNDAGELLSPVCCTSAFGPAVGDTYGGSPERVREMIHHPASFLDVPPVAMPPVPVFDDPPKPMPSKKG